MKFNYRYDVLTQFGELKKFDGNKLWDADFELAKNYQKILWSVDDKVQQMERPGTAPHKKLSGERGEGRYAGRLRNLKKENDQTVSKNHNMANHIIFEEDNVEKISELTENNEILKEKLAKASQENDKFLETNESLQIRLETLELDNRTLKIENNNMTIILDENKDLKEKIGRLELGHGGIGNARKSVAISRPMDDAEILEQSQAFLENNSALRESTVAGPRDDQRVNLDTIAS